jgi:phage terminase large subunit
MIVENVIGLEVGIVYEVNRQMSELYRLIVHEGGTRSGKTFNTIEWLIDEALKTPFLEITIASRDMPHLKKGAMKDFLDIMIKRRKMYDEEAHNKTEHKYEFANGSYIEFLNADEIGKVSGPGRDILYCNEVNFFKWPVFQQLLMRTRKYCIVDYNPIHSKHWIYDKVLIRKDCYLWKSTYQDNKRFLPTEQVLEIEMMKETDPLMWQVYGLGIRASAQKGQIYGTKPYKPWNQITLTEYEAIDAKEVLGIDWGYFPDPTVVVGCKHVGNKRYYRKYIYKQNLDDDKLVEELNEFFPDKDQRKRKIIVADHSTKSNNYLRKNGYPLLYAALKPKGSIDQGIKELRSKEVYYVGDPDFEFEYSNYVYLLGPDDEPTGEAQDKYNHIMDAIRYVQLYSKHLKW